MVTVTILPRSVRSFGSNRPHAHARRPLSPPRTLLALFTAAIVGVVALNVYQNFDALLMFVFLLFAAAMAYVVSNTIMLVEQLDHIAIKVDSETKASYGVVWRGVAWRGVAWRGVAWRGVAWRGVA